MPVARHLLVASLSLFAAAAGAAQTHYAWVGTYNPNGEGLYRFTVDAKTGALRDKTLVSSLPNVAQLTVSRDGKTLYAASEVEKGVVQALSLIHISFFPFLFPVFLRSFSAKPRSLL